MRDVKTKTRSLTGFCNPSHPDPIHETCEKFAPNASCDCACHLTPAAEETPAMDSTPLAASEAEDVPAPDAPRLQVTTACLLPDLDEAVYHGDPVPTELGGSISQSGAKLLLSPSTPAHFRWAQDNPPEMRREFSVGHAVHAKVLGVGAPVAVIDGNRNSTAVKEAVAQAEAEGKIVLKSEDFDACEAMAESVLAHPIAAALFEKGWGTPEVSAFWQDAETNVFLRARFDWLPDEQQGRVIVPDLKTTIDANPAHFGKTAANFGYYLQAWWYLEALAAHGIGDESNAFVFVCVEKKPPYPVSVVQLDDEAMSIGRSRMRQAIDIYAACMESGEWPGYSTEVARASLPSWFARDVAQ